MFFHQLKALLTKDVPANYLVDNVIAATTLDRHSLRCVPRTPRSESTSYTALWTSEARFLIWALHFHKIVVDGTQQVCFCSFPWAFIWAIVYLKHSIKSYRVISAQYIYDVIFPRLHVLGLQYNQMKYIVLSRLHMPNLGRLNINNNGLVTIEPIGVLLNGVSRLCHQLEVSLRGNPWHCNDSLSWIYDNTH